MQPEVNSISYIKQNLRRFDSIETGQIWYEGVDLKGKPRLYVESPELILATFRAMQEVDLSYAKDMKRVVCIIYNMEPKESAVEFLCVMRPIQACIIINAARKFNLKSDDSVFTKAVNQIQKIPL